MVFSLVMFSLGMYEYLRATLISAPSSSASYGSKLRHVSSTVVMYFPWDWHLGAMLKLGLWSSRHLGLGEGNTWQIFHPFVCWWSCDWCCWITLYSPSIWVVILWVATCLAWAAIPCLLAQSNEFIHHPRISCVQIPSLSWSHIPCTFLHLYPVLDHLYLYSFGVYKSLWCY